MLTSAFAGPEPMDHSKVVMTQPELCDPRWYVSVAGSVDFNVGSEFSSGINDEAVGNSDLTILKRDWDDVFENVWNVQVEVGYALTNHIELFGNFRYEHADSKIVTGSVADFGFFDLEFVSQYGDYNSYGGELGVRYYFLPKDAKIRPYVSAAAGVSFVDAISLRADSELFGNNITFYNDSFYDSSIVGTVAGMLGVEFNVTCHLSVGIEGGIRWQSELDGDDSGFERAANDANSQTEFLIFERLKDINNQGDRFSIPVNVYAKLRF
jgi:hypothetical protein